MKNIFAFDLDGTLLDSSGKIPQSAKDAVKLIHSKGDFAVINTGRHYKATHEIASDINIDYSINLNGGEIFDFNSNLSLWRKRYSYDESLELLKQAYAHKTPVYIYAEDFIYLWELGPVNENLKDYFVTYFTYTKFKVLEPELRPDDVMSFIEKNNLKINKLIFEYVPKISKNENYEDMFNDLTDSISHISSYYKGIEGYNQVETSPLNTNKYLGMLKLKEILSLPNSSKIVFFGDNYNDIQALEESDFSYVMSDAPDEVKEYANKVTKINDQDGILFGVEDFYNNIEKKLSTSKKPTSKKEKEKVKKEKRKLKK